MHPTSLFRINTESHLGTLRSPQATQATARSGHKSPLLLLFFRLGNCFELSAQVCLSCWAPRRRDKDWVELATLTAQSSCTVPVSNASPAFPTRTFGDPGRFLLGPPQVVRETSHLLRLTPVPAPARCLGLGLFQTLPLQAVRESLISRRG